jgi:hypothetical protein
VNPLRTCATCGCRLRPGNPGPLCFRDGGVPPEAPDHHLRPATRRLRSEPAYDERGEVTQRRRTAHHNRPGMTAARAAQLAARDEAMAELLRAEPITSEALTERLRLTVAEFKGSLWRLRRAGRVEECGRVPVPTGGSQKVWRLVDATPGPDLAPSPTPSPGEHETPG